MSKSTNNPKKEQSTTSQNVKDQNKQISPLIKREELKGTPFVLIKQSTGEKDQYFMVMGDHRITEPTNTRQEQIKKLETEKWLLMMHIAVITQTKLQEMTQLTRTQKEVIRKLHGMDLEQPTSAKPMIESLKRIEDISNPS